MILIGNAYLWGAFRGIHRGDAADAEEIRERFADRIIGGVPFICRLSRVMIIDQQLRRLATGERHERLAALRALTKLGAEAAPAVAALIKALGDKETAIRSHAAEALRGIGPGAAGAVAALTRALSDERALVRKNAARALGAIGPAAVEAVDELFLAVLTDVDSGVRREAAAAVALIGPGRLPLRQMLEELLEGEEHEARAAAIRDYREWGVFKGLLVNSEVRETRVRVAARAHPRTVSVLLGCGTTALPAMVEALDSRRREVLLVVGDALTQIAKTAPEPALRAVLPALKRAIARERAAKVVARLTEAVRAIEGALTHLKDLPIPAAREAAERLDLPIPHSAEEEGA